MTRAAFRQADIERIIRATEKTGAAVQVDLKSLVVTIFPGAGTAPKLVAPTYLAPDGLENWDDEPVRNNSARRSSTNPIDYRSTNHAPLKGKGGYEIFDDPSHPLKQYYDKLGFDPRTMNSSDMARLREEADARWKASIPGTELGKREKSALGKMVVIGVDVHVLARDVKGCGDDTLDRLEARGFIGRKQLMPPEKVKAGYSQEEIWLLQPGLEAFQASYLKREQL
jgi:hypothetical protein